jgi:hypothetical protein
MSLEVNGIKYPLVYNAFSKVMGKPYCVVIVEEPGKWREYTFVKGLEGYIKSSENYNESAKHTFDDPEIGIAHLPLNYRWEYKYQIEVEIIQGASKEKIEELLKDDPNKQPTT